MSLLGAPSDVLGPILEYVELSDLVSLYMIGNRQFYRKLVVAKSMRRVEVKPELVFKRNTREKPDARWPRLRLFSQITPLQYFPCIVDLRLDFSNHKVVLDDVEPVLQLDLRRLTLKIANASNLFFDSNRQVRPLYRIFRHMNSLEWADTKSIDSKMCTDPVLAMIGKRMPRSLTRLSLATWSRFPSSLVDNLPTEIEHLSLIVCDSANARDFKMPPSLQEFVLSTAAEILRLHSHLPESLTSLSVRGLPESTTSWTSKSLLGWQESVGLPPSLTILRLSREVIDLSPWVCLFPRTLVHLIVPLARMSDDAIEVLPKSLRTLKVLAQNATSQAFRLLPPSLTTLSCGFNVLPEEVSSVAYLPSSITKFRYRNSLVKFVAKHFPREILHLTLSFPPDDLDELPPNLISFKISQSSIFKPEDLNLLPKTLQRLHLESPDMGTRSLLTPSMSSNPATNSRNPILDSKPLSFPPRLAQIVITGNFFSPDFELPSTLTHLYLPYSIIPSSILEEFPPFMRYFFSKFISIDVNVSHVVAKRLQSRPNPDEPIALTDTLFYEAALSILPKFGDCKAFTLNMRPALLDPLPRSITSMELAVGVWALRPRETLYVPSELKPDFENCFHFDQQPFLPQLKSLALRIDVRNRTDNAERGTGGSCRMSVEDMNALPSSLTHLEFQQELGIDVSHIGAQISGSTVDGRTRVSGSNFDLWLPRFKSLSHLEIRDFYGFMDLFKLLPQLPPSTMRTLKLHSVHLDFSVLSLLPPSLTALTAKAMTYGHKSPKEAFEALPKYLTSFELVSFNIRLLGPCTSMLHPSEVSNRHPFLMQWIEWVAKGESPVPQDITTVALDTISHLDDSLFDRLPPTVTKISLSENHNITTKSIPKWPKSLTSIHLGSLIFSKNDLGDISSSSCVDFDWAYIMKQLEGKFPLSLTELKIDCEGVSNETDWVSMLPKTVMTVDLKDNVRLFDHDLKKLPQGITALRLPSNRRLTSKCVEFLPKTLKEVVLPNLPSTDESLRNLPPNLTKLVLSHTSLISDAAIPSLPKSLEYLDIYQAKITESSLPLFPSQLKVLKLRQVLLNGSASKGCETISFITLVSNALASLPSEHLEQQPILEFELSGLKFLSQFDKSTKHILLPNDQVEMGNVLVKPKAGVVYRHPFAARSTKPIFASSRLSLSVVATPVSLAPMAQVASKLEGDVSRWFAYSLTDPRPPPRLLSSPDLIKPITVYWTFQSDCPMHLDQLPGNLERLILFHCPQMQNTDSKNLSHLTSLHTLALPHSRSLGSSCLENLPPALQDLHLDLEDCQPETDFLGDSMFTQPRLQSLPPHLTRLTLSNIFYEGSDTSSLRRPQPRQEEDIEDFGEL